MSSYLGRRRAGGVPAGYLATLPAEDVTAHGAGYPLTYHFTVPPGSGYLAQWRRSSHSAWSTMPAAPSGRFDGLDGVARFSGTDAYVSKAFADGDNELYLRIVDSSGAEVGIYSDVSVNYDNRVSAVAFTYDDNPTTAKWEAATAAHRAAALWMSPGLNSGNFDPAEFGPTNLSAKGLADATALGYVEPINHSRTHINADNYTSQADADSEIIGGKNGLLSATAMPAQSRGRVHGYIYPNGAHNIYAYTACGSAGHLTARLVLPSTTTVDGGTYTPGTWDSTYGLVTMQMPSVCPIDGTIRNEVDLATQTSGAQKVLDSVNYAKSIGGQCIVYCYILHWSWADGSPYLSMLSTVGAMTDIWSVGYGHLALYQRTRDRVTVTDMTP